MTAPDKAAPIPADVLHIAEGVIAVHIGHMDRNRRSSVELRDIIARAILADREARPSLPDSRERTREDERKACAALIAALEVPEPGFISQHREEGYIAGYEAALGAAEEAIKALLPTPETQKSPPTR